MDVFARPILVPAARSWLNKLGYGVAAALLAPTVLWGAAALAFDFPIVGLRIPAMIGYSLLAVSLVWMDRRRPLRAAFGLLLLFASVLAWWLSLRPSNERAWQADVDRTASALIEGDRVAIHNFRNFEYRTEFDYTPYWETKTVSLADLRHVDLFLVTWGVPGIAHLIVSFQFGDNDHVAFSVETRKEIGEEYSAIRGFFRQFELHYVVADERDVVRLRTNYRQGENAYLYRMRIEPDRAKEIFLAMIAHVNRLAQKPEWYNAVTSNCTTAVIKDLVASGGAPVWDLRVLLNDSLDRAAYDRNHIVVDAPWPEYRHRAHINAAARSASREDFPRAIRAGRPGF
jgi:hypothetical protein